MAVKTAIDGSLLADCERLGHIRFGMFRVAEEITKRVADDQGISLSLVNTRQTIKDDHLLRSYVSKLNAGKKIKILSHLFAGSKIYNLQRIAVKANKTFYPGSFAGLNKYDLFHSFYFPFSENITKSKIKKCMTLLDIIPLRHEGYPQLVELTKSIVESIVPNFGIAISQFSKEDICDYDKRIDPQRIFVVPLAADKTLFYKNTSKEDWQRVKKKYGLPDNYFLSISGLDKRKNLEHLIYSFNKLVQQQNTEDLHLVMTGNVSFENTLFHELDIAKTTKDKIIFAKSIEEADLSIVYSNALCFFFMSRYEGFGLPALEAMQCATPVVTSNATSLPEVVGEAGVMLPPEDGDALCSTMWKIYNDSELRSRLSMLGLKRAEVFSWEKCADAYKAIFKQIGA